ncbi:hypothetical protein HMPREF9140_01708 [Prevotella micans F0438]|uniref:Uncharacterized protein n=3 Tax=Prevotella micans TaxID=189723 RepID=H1Q470_9BACT|nr:hypothetical protein HMPREF9140_01708 [Prevotella micans F0438]
MHSVGPRIIILCGFGRQVARSLNPYFGRQVATWTDANSGQNGPHVGTDPVSVRPIRQVGMNIWADRSEYIMRSVDRIGIDSDRHGVCPYMRAERPSWHGVGRDNDKNPFHNVQNGRDDGNIGFVDMQNHPYINNTLSYAVDFSMTDGVGCFYAVDSSMTDGIGCSYAVDSTMTYGVGRFYAVDFTMTDGVGHFYAVNFTMTYDVGCFYAVDSIATMVLVVSTP